MSNHDELLCILKIISEKNNDIDIINFLTTRELNFKYKYLVLIRYLYNKEIQFITNSSIRSNIHNFFSIIHSNTNNNQHVLYVQSNELKELLIKIHQRCNKLDKYTYESIVLCNISLEYLTSNKNISENLIYLQADFKLFNLSLFFDTLHTFNGIKLSPTFFRFNENEKVDDTIENFITKKYYGTSSTYYRDDEFKDINIYSKLQKVAKDLKDVGGKSAKYGNSSLCQIMHLILKIRNSFTPKQKNLIYILTTTSSLGLVVSKIRENQSKSK
ncbi:hypothetical protein TONV_128 [Tipula oleracea nudivirus]|uniref:Uncharacterized protein n=1 Tax=Tipula oleracea nudivirus TaxID=1546257 RepID=A0A0B4VGW0_9VIRU|nr:hypothetical protein TONV_128 [Tipula oleracea nudivirus]AJD20188.1 hypothetical protein TONV_128 [Tipula oleracea nudivirus]